MNGLKERFDEHLKNETMKGQPISSLLQILVCLRFLATGSFQIILGDDVRIDRSTVSRINARVLPLIASLREQHIRMPSTAEEIADTKLGFQSIAGFPQVIGCIDGSHVPIQSPGGDNTELYRCRKGFFSFNLQIVCDYKLKINDIVARWPGSTHESTIFNSSLIKLHLEEGRYGTSIILGDSAYPASHSLLTPLAQVNSIAGQHYQAAHTATRNVVERTIGVWKRRFPAMSQQLRLKKETSLIAIVASAVLHNMAVDEGLELPDEPIPEEADVEMIYEGVAANANAVAFRNVFINQHFN